MLRKRLYSILFLFVICFTAQAQHVVVKTNILHDATLTPHLGFEVRVAPRWTMGLSAAYHPFPLHDAEKKWKHVLISPEARYWLCSAFSGHFIGGNLIYAHYNAGHIRLPFGQSKRLRNERYQGDFGGIGIFYGYSWILSNRWSIEAEAGIGYGFTHYKRYNCAKCGAYKGTANRHMVMPAKLGISIIYNID